MSIHFAASFHAGAGRADLSPPPGIPQGGWGAQTHQRSLGNDLPLAARALALKSDDAVAVIIDADAIGFDMPMTNRIIDAVCDLTSLPRESVRLSCTHTHSGPNTFRLATIREGLDLALAYLEWIPKQIAGAAWQAMRNLKPARFAVSSGSCDINVNRRCRDDQGRTFVGWNPDGFCDPAVHLLRFDDSNGEPIATIVHYACHATTMGWQNEWVTPDFPGQAKETVEHTFGGTCLFLQGAAGNLGPRRGFTGDLHVYRRLGTILGLEAAKLAWNTDTQPTTLALRGIQESGARIGLYDEIATETTPPVLRVVTTSIDLPVRVHPEPDGLELISNELRAKVVKLRSDGAPDAEVREANARATQAGMAAERARLFHGKSSVPWPVQIIQIGHTALVGIAGEPFAEIGARIREASPFAQTLVSGYTNGGFGYIPTHDAWEGGGYEVETTPFTTSVGDVLVDGVSDVMHRMNNGDLTYEARG